MNTILLQPIAFVQNSRLVPEDDHWDSVPSVITLAEGIPESSLEGIESFSHLEIIYYFHLVPDEKAIPQFRHPRGNLEFPKLGTFAQRNKARPNRLGATIVRLLSRDGRSLRVARLDAINGTPVLDIKPVMKAFLPDTETREPDWAGELLKNYW